MKYEEIIDELTREIGKTVTQNQNLMETILSDEFVSRNKESAFSEHYETANYELDNHGDIIAIVLTGCNLQRIPTMLFDIPTLQIICLAGNRIKIIDENINIFSNLEFLDLSHNEVSEIPQTLYSLSTLKILFLQNNLIETISKNIGQLRNLTTLYLSWNKIKIIPIEILELDILWGCIDKIIQIKSQKYRVVRSQQYEEAAELRNQEKNYYLEGNFGINLNGNDIDNLPPELVLKGREEIIEYWKSLDESESLPVNEFKLILVGEGGSGKTSLMKQFKNEKFDENQKQTHGINICSWNVPNKEKIVTANLWDFGGQEIMHATHQFFLSNRSMYIIVIDSRKEEKIEYWLKHIEALANSSPTFVVINKIDENPGFDLNRKFLMDKYSNIINILRVSCSSGEGIDELIKSISNSLDRINHLNTRWPKTWFNLKQKLEKTNEDYISPKNYTELCKDSNIYSKKSQDTLLDFLHDLGVMLHFKDFDLNHTNVLNPRWITEGVYKIINSRELSDHFGTLSRELLTKILPKKKYPDIIHQYLISLMEKFELCYKISANEILIPDLLNIQEPEYELNSSLNFIFQYNFLPRSIFPRLIVRMRNDVKEDLAWRTGVILQNEKLKSEAKIVVDYEEKRIYIKVRGYVPREYFAAIYHTINDINNSFLNLNISERIQVGSDKVSIGYQHLKTLEEKGVFSYIPEGFNSPIDVSETLGSFTKSRKEIIEEELLNRLIEIGDKMPDKDKLIKEANRLLELKPNIAGIGINLNAIIDKFLKRKK